MTHRLPPVGLLLLYVILHGELSLCNHKIASDLQVLSRFISRLLTKLHFTFLSFPAKLITAQVTDPLGKHDLAGKLLSKCADLLGNIFGNLGNIFWNEKGALRGSHIGCFYVEWVTTTLLPASFPEPAPPPGVVALRH